MIDSRSRRANLALLACVVAFAASCATARSNTALLDEQANVTYVTVTNTEPRKSFVPEDVGTTALNLLIKAGAEVISWEAGKYDQLTSASRDEVSLDVSHDGFVANAPIRLIGFVRTVQNPVHHEWWEPIRDTLLWFDTPSAADLELFDEEALRDTAASIQDELTAAGREWLPGRTEMLAISGCSVVPLELLGLRPTPNDELARRVRARIAARKKVSSECKRVPDVGEIQSILDTALPESNPVLPADLARWLDIDCSVLSERRDPRKPPPEPAQLTAVEDARLTSVAVERLVDRAEKRVAKSTELMHALEHLARDLPETAAGSATAPASLAAPLPGDSIECLDESAFDHWMADQLELDRWTTQARRKQRPTWLSLIAVAEVRPVPVTENRYRITLLGYRYSALKAKNFSPKVPFTDWHQTKEVLAFDLAGAPASRAYAGGEYRAGGSLELDWDRGLAADGKPSAWVSLRNSPGGRPQTDAFYGPDPDDPVKLTVKLAESSSIEKALEQLSKAVGNLKVKDKKKDDTSAP